MTKFVAVAALLLAGTSMVCGGAAVAQAAPVAQTSAADARLKALYDGYARWDTQESAYFQDADGDLKASDHLPRVDAASQQKRQAYLENALQQLNAIPEAQLSENEKVNAEVFRTVLENALIELKYRTWEMPFNSDSSFWTYLDEGRQLRDAAEYRRYIARMRDIPRFFEEEITNMRAGIARGYTVPKATLTGRDKSIATFAEADLDKSPFYKAFKTMPSTIPAAEQAALRKEGADAIRQAVLPAYGKLLNFYTSEYYPKSRTTVSAHDLPNGDEFYKSQVREYTTTDLSPEEIHQIGL